MVVADDRQHIAKGSERGTNSLARDRVLLHDFSFFWSKRSGFEQDMLRHSQLTYIVHKTASAKSDPQVLWQPQFLCQRDGTFRKAVAVPFGIGILCLDTQREARQYGLGVVQLICELLSSASGNAPEPAARAYLRVC